MKTFAINSSVDSVDLPLRPNCALAGELGRVVDWFGLLSGMVEGIGRPRLQSNLYDNMAEGDLR